MDLIEKQDNEREFISNELYQIANQTIYSMILGIKMVLSLDMDEKLREHLQSLEKHSSESLEKIRELSFSLYPIMIKDLGFLPTLRTLIEKFEKNSDIKIYLEILGCLKNLCIEKEVLLYRLCYEAFTYFKEMKVKEIHLKIIELKKIISMQIKTSPVLNITKDLILEHLYIMKKRAKIYRGTFDLIICPTNEVTIKITIPIQD